MNTHQNTYRNCFTVDGYKALILEPTSEYGKINNVSRRDIAVIDSYAIPSGQSDSRIQQGFVVVSESISQRCLFNMHMPADVRLEQFN